MSPIPPRVVLDTVVLVQALVSGRGTAAGCVERLRLGRFILLMSDATLDELADVPLRPKFVAKYSFVTPEKVAAFIADLQSFAVMIPRPPTAFELPRDPKDEPFIDLAVAGEARYLVTWNDRHLTYLMRRDTPEGKDFCNRFPGLAIVSPPDFLRMLDVVTP